MCETSADGASRVSPRRIGAVVSAGPRTARSSVRRSVASRMTGMSRSATPHRTCQAPGTRRAGQTSSPRPRSHTANCPHHQPTEGGAWPFPFIASTRPPLILFRVRGVQGGYPRSRGTSASPLAGSVWGEHEGSTGRIGRLPRVGGCPPAVRSASVAAQRWSRVARSRKSTPLIVRDRTLFLARVKARWTGRTFYQPIRGVPGRGWAAIQGPDHSSSNSIMRTSISRFSLKR